MASDVPLELCASDQRYLPFNVRGTHLASHAMHSSGSHSTNARKHEQERVRHGRAELAQLQPFIRRAHALAQPQRVWHGARVRAHAQPDLASHGPVCLHGRRLSRVALREKCVSERAKRRWKVAHVAILRFFASRMFKARRVDVARNAGSGWGAGDT